MGLRIEVGKAELEDARFLAAMDADASSENDKIRADKLRGRRVYWDQRLSDEAGRNHTFVARVGGLFAGYLAMNGEGEESLAPTVHVTERFIDSDVSAHLLEYAGVEVQASAPLDSLVQ